MKTRPFRLVMILLVSASMLLTSCEYPYYYNNGYGAGPNQRSGTVYGALAGAGFGAIIGNQSRRPLEGALIGGVLGGLAGNVLGANRDRYYTVRSNSVFSGRYYYGRPVYYTSSYRPYTCPPYRYSPYYSGYNYRPWGGYYGRSYPYSGWGTTGLGFGTRWF